ncbi:MAG: hypothetical protein ACI39W_10530 [Brotaphodocola sp.]
MPNFNYENPRNVNGSSMQSPEEQLFALVLETLAYEGYQNLTKKRLLEKGADEELLRSYPTREDLCEAVLLDAAERMRLIYEPITADAIAYLESGAKTRDESWKQLERLLYRHIYQCFHPKNRNYVLAAIQESMLPAGLNEILPNAMYDCFGNVLSQMIMAVSEVKKAPIAAMMTCSICGTINTFVQQAEYCKKVFIGATREKPNYAVVEDFLNNYFLRSIAVNTAINKPF